MFASNLQSLVGGAYSRRKQMSAPEKNYLLVCVEKSVVGSSSAEALRNWAAFDGFLRTSRDSKNLAEHLLKPCDNVWQFPEDNELAWVIPHFCRGRDGGVLLPCKVYRVPGQPVEVTDVAV